MIKEFCAENFTNIPKAIAAGIDRIELCDNLAVGGPTPSYGVIKQTVEFAHQHGVKVMVIVRPRGGNFIYDDQEINIILDDIEMIRELDADGVVFGALRDDKLDQPTLDQLLKASAGMDVTFHMAFDELGLEEQFNAIDWLSSQGVQRILTHGGSSKKPIEAHLDILKELQSYARDRLIILPGGGVHWENLNQIDSVLRFPEYHGTKIINLNV